MAAVRVLIDVVHPSHVHYFRPVRESLEARGHRTLVTARDKDCTLELLRAFGIPFVALSRAARSRWGLAGELVVRDWRLWRVARRFRPDVVLGKEAACAHQVAWALGVPSVAVDDTDDARLQRWLSLPFARVICGDPAAGLPPASVPLEGPSPLAYLHPSRFRPDPRARGALGLGDDPVVLVRLVRWTSSHDYGERGIGDGDLPALVAGLSSLGRVVISSERELPPALRAYRLDVPPARLHDLLAECRLAVTESATVAAEAVVLGVPAVYASTRRLWYTEQLRRRGLIAEGDTVSQWLAASRSLAAHRSAWRRRWRRYLTGCPDPVADLVAAVEAAGSRSKVGSH